MKLKPENIVLILMKITLELLKKFKIKKYILKYNLLKFRLLMIFDIIKNINKKNQN